MSQPEIEVVKYLREKGLDSLIKEHCITAKAHKKYPELVSLSYDQLKSDFKSPIVQQCRGIIVDTSNNFNVISLPYTKFFNYCESNAAKIDWKTARVTEKVDGSLMIVYFYKEEWHVSSSGMPDASGNVHLPRDKVKLLDKDQKRKKMSELFWEVWAELKYEYPKDKDLCYIFELFSTENVVLIRAKKNQIILHGARNMKTFKEIFPEEIVKYTGWECVKFFEMKSIEEVVDASKKLNPVESEGFVVCDSEFNRVKIKSPQYVALAQSSEKKGITDKRILEIIRLNDSDEFLGYFPHFTEKYKRKKNVYDELCVFLENMYKEYKDLETLEFKKQISMKYPDWSNTLITIQSKSKKSIQEVLKGIDIGQLESLVQKYELIIVSKELESLLKESHQSQKRNELKEMLSTVFKDNIGEFGSIALETDVFNSSFDFYLIQKDENVDEKMKLISKEYEMKDDFIYFKFKDVDCILSLKNQKDVVEDMKKKLGKNSKKLIKILKILLKGTIKGYEIQEKVLSMKKIDKDSNAQLLTKFIHSFKKDIKGLDRIETLLAENRFEELKEK